ncbi:MAG: O-antigen ligase family protein [Fuerstiella sp.]
MRNLSLSLLLLTVLVAPWLIGGYTALARFLCVAGLLLAAVIMWLDFQDARRAVSRHRRVILAVMSLPMIGLIQLLVTRTALSGSLLDWSGVPSIRDEFGDSSRTWLLTLSPWLTRSWLVLSAIGAGGFALSVALTHSTRARIATLIVLATSGVLQVFWGVIQSVRFPNDIFWGIPNPGNSSPFGTFLNCNHAADFMGISLGAALGLAWWWHRKGTRDGSREYQVKGIFQSILSSPVSFLLWLLIGWLLLGVLVSTSRGAILSLVVAFILLPLCWRQAHADRRGIALGIGLFCLSTAVVGIQVIGLEDRVDRGLEVLDFEKASNDARFTHWAEALPAVRYFLPLGSGFGTYGYAYLPFGPEASNGWFTYAHNQYLEVLMEGGLLALAVVLLVIAMLFNACLRLCRSDRSSLDQGIGLAGMFALLMQSLHAFTDFGLMMPANLLALAVLLGMTVRTATDEASQSRTAESRWQKRLLRSGGILIAVALTAGLGAAFWQQTFELKSERLLAATRFDPATPGPDLKTSVAWRDLVQTEWQQQPQNERLLRRLIQLNIHVAQTESFDAVVAKGLASDIAWEATSIEANIARLFDEDDPEFTSERKAAVHAAIRSEANLKNAMDGLQQSQKLNPIQPRLHYRLAMLKAAFGQPWRQDHVAAIRLSATDPRLSLGNGLLAWAAGSKEAFISLWQQTLSVQTNQAMFIIQLARQQLSEDEIANDLMPNNSVVVYRIGQQMKGEDNADLRDKILRRSLQTSNTTQMPEQTKLMIQAKILNALGEFQQAVTVRETLSAQSPKDPEARYQLALAYQKAGNLKEAAAAARVAFRLAPTTERYRVLLERAQARQRNQKRSAP